MKESFVKEIILNKRVKIADIIVAKTKIYNSPFRCSWRKRTNYNPHKKKIRGNKFGYMILVKYVHDNYDDDIYSFGFRLYTKKAALHVANHIESPLSPQLITIFLNTQEVIISKIF